MSFWTYIVNNLNYYLVVLVTLFLWDLVDVYVELKEFGNFRFLSRKEFWVYYFVVAFFSIGAMEAGYILNVFTTESKYIISFLIPLVFAIILENLIVKIGGLSSEKSIDIAQFFERFRHAIKESLIRREDMTKVQIQTRLLNSSIASAEIIDWCRFYSTDEDLKKLSDKLHGLSPRSSRIEVIKYLVKQAKAPDVADLLFREARRTKPVKEKDKEKE